MLKRYFEFKDTKSNKFWEISISGKTVTINYGKIGTNGQISAKDLNTPKDAEKHAEKQITSKLKKGYKEI